MMGLSVIHFSRSRTVTILLTTWMAFLFGCHEYVTANPTIAHHASWGQPSQHRFKPARLACLRGGGSWRFAPPVADRFDAKATTKPPSEVTAAKEQMNAFLTRDSRNHFIGTLIQFAIRKIAPGFKI
jgi:hypothetical protein